MGEIYSSFFIPAVDPRRDIK